MLKNLSWRILTIIVVLVVFTMVGVYPIASSYYKWPMPEWLAAKQLKLGLDLKGGVHLELRVLTDTALKAETEAQAERTREALTTAGVNVTGVTPVNNVQFRVDGVPSAQAQAFLQTVADAESTFDRGSGTNGSYTFTMKPNLQKSFREESVRQARTTIER